MYVYMYSIYLYTVHVMIKKKKKTYIDLFPVIQWMVDKSSVANQMNLWDFSTSLLDPLFSV